VRAKFFDLTALLVFSIMIDYRFFQGEGGIPGFTLTEVVGYGMFFLLFCLFCFRKGPGAETVLTVYRSNRPLMMYFVWLFFAALLGIVVASSYEGFWLFKDSIPSLLVYSFVILYVKDTEQLKKVLWIYIIGASIGFMLGFLQGNFGRFYVVEENWASPYKMDISGYAVSGNLVRGFLTHPNGFAGFYLPAVILIVVSLLKGLFRGDARKLFLFSLVPVILFDYYYTYAKGAWAWLLFGLFFLFLPKKLGKYRHPIAWISLPAGITFIVIASITEFFRRGGASGAGTMVTRIQLWMAGIVAMQEQHSILFFGNGGKTMLSISPSFAGLDYPNTHNGILNLVIFYGFPALLFYLLAFGVTLRKLSRSLEKAEFELRSIGLFSFSSLVALLGIYFFEPWTAGVNMQANFFLIMAVSIKFNEFMEEKPGMQETCAFAPRERRES
jgi:hypothetical protein